MDIYIYSHCDGVSGQDIDGLCPSYGDREREKEGYIVEIESKTLYLVNSKGSIAGDRVSGPRVQIQIDSVLEPGDGGAGDPVGGALQEHGLSHQHLGSFR